MKRTAVASSSVSAVGYDASTSVLEIEFVNGGVYRYFMVPRRIAQGLLGASSKGRFVHAQIRDVYASEKLR